MLSSARLPGSRRHKMDIRLRLSNLLHHTGRLGLLLIGRLTEGRVNNRIPTDELGRTKLLLRGTASSLAYRDEQRHSSLYLFNLLLQLAHLILLKSSASARLLPLLLICTRFKLFTGVVLEVFRLARIVFRFFVALLGIVVALVT